MRKRPAVGVIFYMYDSSAPVNPEAWDSLPATADRAGGHDFERRRVALKQYIDQHPGQSVTSIPPESSRI